MSSDWETFVSIHQQSLFTPGAPNRSHAYPWVQMSLVVGGFQLFVVT